MNFETETRFIKSLGIEKYTELSLINATNEIIKFLKLHNYYRSDIMESVTITESGMVLKMKLFNPSTKEWIDKNFIYEVDKNNEISENCVSC